MMAPEAQFASLDGTAFHGEENEFQPNPNAIARRSISIFSRRGTETPEPKPPFIAQEAMRAPKQLMEKQKSWIKRKSCPVSSSTQKKPKVTILNAVPPAKTIRMTPLEEEMATSPNEEILSAVSASPVQSAFPSPTLRMPSTQQSSNFWNRSAVSLTQQTKSQRRRDSNTRIGVWVDGIAHLDGPTRQFSFWDEEPSLQQQTGFTPLVPIPAAGLSASQARPQLSVVIPGSEPLVNDTTVSTIVQPMPQRPVVSVAPASIVTKFALSTPTITVQEHADVSPLESSPVRHPAPPVERPKAPLRGDVLHDEPTPNQTWPRLSSSSSSGSLVERDDSSQYSQRSSATSVEAVAASEVPQKADAKKPDSSPDAVFDNSSRVRPNVNKPLPPRPFSHIQLAAPPSSPSSFLSRAGSKSERSLSTKSTPGRRSGLTVEPIKPLRSSRSLSELDVVDRAFLRSAPFYDAESPTLSQAADDLEAHLSTIAEDGYRAEETKIDNEQTLARTTSIARSDSVRSVMQPPERAPTLPKRSRKREWRVSRNARHSVQFPKAKAPRRRRSESSLWKASIEQAESVTIQRLRKASSAFDLSRKNDSFTATASSPEQPMPPPPRIVIDDGLIVLHGPVTVHGGVEQDGNVSSASAEEVLLHILSALTCHKDLSNTALINKGMYRVYKENEMDLIRAVTYNQSPAAWELREWCPPIQFNEAQSSKASLQLEHTPYSYMHCYRRDLDVIESLKALIVERCQTFIRRETAFALSTRDHPHAQRFNDAFWRIWCFCKIFGCGKGREEDITGQLDWLKGGLLANNQDLTATMNMNLDYDMGSVLLNPPEFFATGNAGGLSAQQLYDMTEIWSCLTTILSGYHGRTEQARQSGVLNGCDITGGYVESEGEAVEEWTAYLLTLGPTVVLEMAEFAFDSSSTGFALARMNGWTNWSPLQTSSSRTTFLKEPVSRLYEERVAAAAIRLQNPREQERKELSRKRVANLAAEIKLARQASGYRRLPLIDQSMERPMSALSRHNSTMSTSSVQSTMGVKYSMSVKRSSAPTQGGSRPPNFSVPRPRSPPPTLWAARKISPIIEDRVETFNRMSLQKFAGGVAEDTSDRAVSRIVDMGFSASQAREALRMTDMGDGLRVDRAVDVLLRQYQWQ